MKLYKHYFDKTDTPFEELFQKNKKYHTVWYKGKYRIFLLHKVVKIKFLGIFTIYKLDKHREFIDKKLQEMKRNFMEQQNERQRIQDNKIRKGEYQMKFDKLVKGRCYEDKLGNVYKFNRYTSSKEAEFIVMEYSKEEECYYSTDLSVFMDKFDVLELESWV